MQTIKDEWHSPMSFPIDIWNGIEQTNNNSPCNGIVQEFTCGNKTSYVIFQSTIISMYTMHVYHVYQITRNSIGTEYSTMNLWSEKIYF
jgi:hypothetical protein